MAVVTKTIKKTGGDYSTVASWEAGTNLNSGADIWKGVISDNENYNENVTINAGSGAIGSYVWLTVAEANRHAGVSGTGHARMLSTGSSHIITMDSDYARVEYLELSMQAGGSSDEAFRIASGAANILIEYCIIWATATTSDQDGIYMGNYNSGPIFVSNCYIYGWGRAGIHFQQWGGTSRTLTGSIDHCGIWLCGRTTENSSGAITVESDGASDVIGVTIYNSWFSDTDDDGVPLVDSRVGGSQPETPDGAVTWNGTHNARDDNTDYQQGTDNMTNWQEASSGTATVSKTSGAWIVVNSLTRATANLLLLDAEAGNLPAGNGVDRQGSEPDPRQDFSVDITGSARPTTDLDIGPHQVSEAGGDIFDDDVVVNAAATAIITDQMAIADTGLVSFADALGLVDDDMVIAETSLAVEAAATAVITDGMTVDEALSAVADATAAVNDLMVLAEDMAVEAEATASIVDAQVLVLEALTVFAEALAVITDGFTYTDNLAVEASATATITNLMVQSEILAAEATATAIATDLMTLTDDLIATANATVALTDGQVLVLEALGVEASATVALTDYQTLVLEALTALAEATTSMTDAEIMIDNVEVFADALATITDALVTGEAAALARFLRTRRRDPRGGRQLEGRQLSN